MLRRKEMIAYSEIEAISENGKGKGMSLTVSAEAFLLSKDAAPALLTARFFHKDFLLLANRT